jgi:hypothetical protein
MIEIFARKKRKNALKVRISFFFDTRGISAKKLQGGPENFKALHIKSSFGPQNKN